MGGNAFKSRGVKTVRLDRDKYVEVERDVLSLLRSTFPEGDFRPTSYYADKETFGDIDILFSFPDDRGSETLNKTLFETVKYFGHNKFIRSGEVTSFAVPVDDNLTEFFQIDLIECKAENMEFANSYYGDGDFGIFLGRVARMLGFKLGQYGLEYPYASEKYGGNVHNVMITKDFDQALIMMGYDAERYRNTTFDTIESVFDFTVSGKYFSEYPYTDASQNHAQRKRLKKRNTFSDLNRYIVERNVESKITKDDLDRMRHMTDGKVRLMPHVVAQFEAIDRAIEEKKKRRNAFGREVVQEAVDIDDNKLNKFIASFKEDFMDKHQLKGNQDFFDKMVSMNPDDVKLAIKEFYDNRQV